MSKRGKNRRGISTAATSQVAKTSYLDAGLCLCFICSLLVSVPSISFYERTIDGSNLFIRSFGTGLFAGLLSWLWPLPRISRVIIAGISSGLLVAALANLINWHYAAQSTQTLIYVVCKKSISPTRYPAYWLFAYHNLHKLADVRLTVNRKTYEQTALGKQKVLLIRQGKLNYSIITSVE